MKLDTREIANGIHIGKEVWICDYRYKDFDNKPIRHIQPKKVNIISTEQTTKRIYYSGCFFREGEKKSSVIVLYDNTGYRSFPGVALQVFTTQEECIVAYKSAKKKLKKEFEIYKENILSRISAIEKELN